MSPENMLRDPSVMAVLVGAVAKGKDFAATKGLTVLITAILSIGFSAGIVYNRFEKVLDEMQHYSRNQEIIKNNMEIMKIDISVLKNKVDNVETNISNINKWINLYGPNRLVP